MRRSVLIEEEDEDFSAASATLQKTLRQLLVVHRYRHQKAELDWLRQRKIMSEMDNSLSKLQRKWRQARRDNRYELEKINAQNLQRPLSTRAIKSWINQEHRLEQAQQAGLHQLKEYQARCAAQRERLEHYHHIALAKNKRREKLALLCELIQQGYSGKD